MDGARYQVGFPESVRRSAALLYDEAFAAKLRPAIRDDASRVAILAEGLNPTKSIAALDGVELLGIAGFHDGGGSLTDGISLGSIRKQIGFFRGIKAIAVLAFLDRKPEPGELLMDGIVVRSAARGRGIGTRLFAELEAYSRDHGKDRIRLDVVDTNPEARRLYERLGFEPTKTERVFFLKPIMGFAASTTMVKRLD
jgi:ribosomal protein S18 acetylase RimI-like enzyme